MLCILHTLRDEFPAILYFLAGILLLAALHFWPDNGQSLYEVNKMACYGLSVSGIALLIWTCLRD
jgi:uncharacterized membrane protein SirB2